MTSGPSSKTQSEPSLPSPHTARATTFGAQQPDRTGSQPRPIPFPPTNPHPTKAFRSLPSSLSSLIGSSTSHHDSANTSSQYHGASLISLMTKTLARLMHPQTNQRSRSFVTTAHNNRGRTRTTSHLPTTKHHITTLQPTKSSTTTAHRPHPAASWKTQALLTKAILTLTPACPLR